MNDDNYTPPLPKADDASYSEAVMTGTHSLNTPLLTVDELIQAMRTSGSLSDIRKRLEKLREKDPGSFNVFCRFYGR